MSSDLDFGVPIPDIDNNHSDNFFGDVDDGNDVNDSHIVLSDTTMINPFYVDVRGSQITYMNNKELFTKYKRVLILCRMNGTENQKFDPLFEQVIDKQVYKNCAGLLTLIPASIKMLKNTNHRAQAVIIERINLLSFNSNGIDIENDDVVIPLFELNETDAHLYSSLYSTCIDIHQMIKILMMFRYYNCKTFRYPLQKQLSAIVASVNNSNYWSNKYNCTLNMTEGYTSRKFNYNIPEDSKVMISINGKSSMIKDEGVRSLLDKLKLPKNGSDYLRFIYKDHTYTDASTAINNTGYKIYQIKNAPVDLTKEQVTELFRVTDNERSQYDLLNSFLLSKDLCHLVVNNADVLEIVQPLINKFLPFYRYIWGYAWLCMYMEECIVKTRATIDHRYVFDINTASKLPFFPYCVEDVHLNPYCSLLVNKDVLDSANNCHGLAMSTTYDSYGIDNLEGFKKKLNIFTTGNIDKCIFDGLETEDDSTKWKYFAVGGSLITSCTELQNPLMMLISTPNQSYTEKWHRFFDEYHHDSDIDLMCKCTSVIEFMDKTNDLVNLIKGNLNKLHEKDVSDTVNVEPVKSLVIFVNIQYINEYMKDDFDNPEYVIENFATDEIKDYFHYKYTTLKYDLTRKMRKELNHNNPLYQHHFKMSSSEDMSVKLSSYNVTKNKVTKSDSDICVYVNDLRGPDSQVPEDENILMLKISEGIKFKIKSPNLHHSIEVFKLKFDEVFSCVARFHLPCVRGYYDGDNVYLMPSLVTALMTHVNIDYKYFAGIRDPITIINKYRMRGFGTLVNSVEKVHMSEYNHDIDNAGGMFKVNTKNGDLTKESIEKYYGPRDFTSPMFKPGKHLRGYPDDTYSKPDDTFVNTVNDLYTVYKSKHGYDPTVTGFDMMKFKTIKPDGSVAPVNNWILDAAYDTMS